MSSVTGAGHEGGWTGVRPVISELRRFCETTTVKGVVRSFKSDHTWVRITWLTAVLVCLFLSTAHSFLLLQTYLNYPASAFVKEAVVALRSPEDENAIPEVTVCNIRPIARVRPENTSIPTYEEYIKEIEAKLFCSECDPSIRSRLAPFRGDILSTAGYYQYIGLDNAQKISHQFQNFIIACTVLIAHPPSWGHKHCENLTEIKLFRSDKYFNCYSFRPKEQTIENPIVGYSLVLYLDADKISAHSTKDSFDSIRFGKGAVVNFDQPGAYPFLSGNLIHLAPGQYTLSQINLGKAQRLSHPHGSCSNEDFIGENGTFIRYSGWAKWSLCLAQHIIETCGCKLAGVVDITSNSNVPFCADAHAPADVLAWRLICANITRLQNSVECYHSAPQPCHEATYQPIVSDLLWPSADDIAEFYDTYIANTSIHEQFGTIANLTNNTCVDLRSSCPHLDKIQTRIRENFLAFKSHLSDYRYVLLGSSPAISMTALISQLGGALNLWSGISVIVIVELGEMIIRLIFACLKNSWFYPDRTEKHKASMESQSPSDHEKQLQ